MNNFVSIKELQQSHQQQLAELTAKINALELQLSEQEDSLRKQIHKQSLEHNQQRQDSALAEQKLHLQQLFNTELEQRVEQELVQRCQILTSNIRSIEASYEQLMLSAFEHCTEMATSIVKCITTNDSAIKLDVVRKALVDSIDQQTLNALPLTVQLNPEDANLLAPVWQGQNIKVKTTDSLSSGDVKVSSNLAMMNGILSERISQIMETVNDDTNVD